MQRCLGQRWANLSKLGKTQQDMFVQILLCPLSSEIRKLLSFRYRECASHMKVLWPAYGQDRKPFLHALLLISLHLKIFNVPVLMYFGVSSPKVCQNYSAFFSLKLNLPVIYINYHKQWRSEQSRTCLLLYVGRSLKSYLPVVYIYNLPLHLDPLPAQRRFKRWGFWPQELIRRMVEPHYKKL